MVWNKKKLASILKEFTESQTNTQTLKVLKAAREKQLVAFKG
jgi:predicted glycosyltransferase involved in capsule biosynthesis